MKRKILLCLIGLLFFGGYAAIATDDASVESLMVVHNPTFMDYDYPTGQDGDSQDNNNSEQDKGESTPSNAGGCNGIKLNTNFPIIGNCIGTSKDSKTNPTNAFPYMIGALTKIIMSLILVVCFIFIIVAGIMWAGSGEDNGQVTKAKGILKKVAIVILLLGFSGAILRLINPSFFS